MTDQRLMEKVLLHEIDIKLAKDVKFIQPAKIGIYTKLKRLTSAHENSVRPSLYMQILMLKQAEHPKVDPLRSIQRFEPESDNSC